jgi:LysM repeat protein
MKGTETKEEPIVDKKDPNLSEEFRDEIIKERKNHNWPAIISVLVISLIMVIVLGIGAYQIFYKKDTSDLAEPAGKIESVPQEDVKTEVKPEETKPAETPVQAPAQTPAPETATPTTYTVEEGDTLGAIASKYGTTVDALMKLNNITDETSLQIGDNLKLK